MTNQPTARSIRLCRVRNCGVKSCKAIKALRSQASWQYHQWEVTGPERGCLSRAGNGTVASIEFGGAVNVEAAAAETAVLRAGTVEIRPMPPLRCITLF